MRNTDEAQNVYIIRGRVENCYNASIVGPGGVLGSTGNMFGCRQRAEGHPLVNRVEATTTANTDYALAA